MVLGGESYRRAGGPSLRWQALCRALGRHLPCTYRRLGCRRWGDCQLTCQASGGPARTDGLARWSGDVIWFYDVAFCPDHADQLAREFKADGVTTVVCSGLETHRYVAALAGHGGFTVIFDMHNVEQALHRAIQQAAPEGSHQATIYTERHVRLVEAAERAALAAADAVWVCSPQDRAVLGALYGSNARAKAAVVPNAIDVPDQVAPAAGGERVCFTGRMDYYPNEAAGRILAYEITPLLRDRGHELPVIIAGAQAQRILGGTSLPPGVRLVSDPASIAELIAGGLVTVPLTVGGGTRFKILEAFAYGAPVISTAKGAEGIDILAGVHYLNAEHPTGFADALDALIRHPELRVRLGHAAWELVRDRYSIDALARELAVHLAGLLP